MGRLTSHSYKYQCPVCGKRTATAMRMVNHILLIQSPPHLAWWQQRLGSLPVRRLPDGNPKLYLKPMITVVERECRIA